MLFSNLARPRKPSRIGLAVAAASALVVTGGWVALSPPAQAALPAGCTQATPGGTVTCTFGYTGAAQTFSVPAGVTSVSVSAWGGRGASGSGSGTGGRGGLASGTFPVAAGVILDVIVAGDGGVGGGFGDGAGGAGGTPFTTLGGGGASAVSNGGNRLLVAGGGGGAGGTSSCGVGGNGGDAGQDGEAGHDCIEGGTDAGGGAGGTAGASSTAAGANGLPPSGGGGGGGYLGGSGGVGGEIAFGRCCSSGGGGGGGTSYASVTGTGVSLSELSERAPGSNGLVTISYLPGTVTQLVVSPASATVAAGQGLAYTANGYTAEGADAGDVTSATTFTISPDGSCAGATCTPASAGPHTVTATYGALVATAALDVTAPPLVYDFSGLLSPIDPAPVVNNAKAGSSVPVRFSLGADYGLDVLAEGSPSSRTVACNSGATADEVEQSVSANKSGLTYDAGSGIYTYVWKTDKKWSGSCRTLSVELADGSSQTVSFSFK